MALSQGGGGSLKFNFPYFWLQIDSQKCMPYSKGGEFLIKVRKMGKGDKSHSTYYFESAITILHATHTKLRKSAKNVISFYC